MQIEGAETDSDVSKSSQELDQNVVTFEQRKIEDIKQILLDLTLIQLKQHVKSMEILSATYQDIAAIDVTKDIEAFKSKFLLQPENKMLQQQMRSQSMNALTSTFPSSKVAKRQHLSNSAGSLESQKRVPAQSNGKMSPASSGELEAGTSQTDTATESDDDDDVADSTSQDDSDSDKEIVQVQRRRRFNRMATDDEKDDETDVEREKNKYTGRSSNAFAKTPGKQGATKRPPVPQVRLSKLPHSKPT